MYSVLQQEKTALRDARGASVYRRLYLCDTPTDLATLPAEDAPGSGAVVAAGGGFYLLDHCHNWNRADLAVGLGGCFWIS